MNPVGEVDDGDLLFYGFVHRVPRPAFGALAECEEQGGVRRHPVVAAVINAVGTALLWQELNLILSCLRRFSFTQKRGWVGLIGGRMELSFFREVISFIV